MKFSKKNKRYNILVWGLLSTGSSALIDILREYENISVIPNEFDDFRAPGLVADQLMHDQEIGYPNKIDNLYTNKRKLKFIYSIFPFLKFNINAISGILDRYKINISRIKSLNRIKELNKQLYKVHSLEKKIELTNNWITAIADIYSKNAEFVVFNQAISPAIKTQIWTKVFDPFKLICVYRDPRDQLAEIIKKGYLYAPYGAPVMNHGGLVLESIFGRSREGALKFHIHAIKKRMEWIDLLKSELNPERFLLVDFEGLSKNYDLYKTVLEKFIGNIKQNVRNQKLFFDPNKAGINIGIHKNYLHNHELEYLSEIENWYHNMIITNNLQKM